MRTTREVPIVQSQEPLGHQVLEPFLNQVRSPAISQAALESAFFGHVVARESFRLVARDLARDLPRHDSPRFHFRVPPQWRAPVPVSRYAEEVEELTLAWFLKIGCPVQQVKKVKKFKPAHYVGVPFPMLPFEKTLLVSKYLSLWLLWDDTDVESRKNYWRLEGKHVFTDERPPGMTRFDYAWLELLQELARAHSPEWIHHLCVAMATWSDAAIAEARCSKRYADKGILPSFAEGMTHRIATIGMYATVYLLEYASDFELPRSFHDHPNVRQMTMLANKIVGLGNDVFSFGKDYANDQINLITALIHERGVDVEEAYAYLIQLHNDALDEFDSLAAGLPSWSPVIDCYIQKWIQDVRYASLGFSVWESEAPRYTEYRIASNGRVIEPRFAYLSE